MILLESVFFYIRLESLGTCLLYRIDNGENYTDYNAFPLLNVKRSLGQWPVLGPIQYLDAGVEIAIGAASAVVGCPAAPKGANAGASAGVDTRHTVGAVATQYEARERLAASPSSLDTI